MARLGSTFAPTAHDTEQTDFGNVPDGIYQLEVIASDVRKDGNNEAVTVTYSVIAPEEYKGRYIFGWFDINHSDPAFQERGNRDFARLCRAIGYDEATEGPLEDSENLHLRAFTARVKDNPAGVSKAGKPFKAKNSIGKFYFPDSEEIPAPEITGPVGGAANDNRPAARQPAPAAQQAARPATTGARPWGKK
ncbi:hypothetical protein ABIA16_003833 [Sinorhizobium fredii]